MPRTVAQILDVRLLNSDAAGLAVERLSQRRLAGLVAWFDAPYGGASGRRFLYDAPLFDTVAQRCVHGVTGCRAAPRESALAWFGVGLGLGGHWLGHYDVDGPFQTDVDFDEVIGSLSDYHLPPELAGSSEDGEADDDTGNPLELATRLCGLDARVDVAVEALFRLAAEGNGGTIAPRALVRHPRARLVLFGGLLAAGIRVPPPPESAPRIDQ